MVGAALAGQVPAGSECKTLGQTRRDIQTGQFGSQLHAELCIGSCGLPSMRPRRIHRGDRLRGTLELSMSSHASCERWPRGSQPRASIPVEPTTSSSECTVYILRAVPCILAAPYRSRLSLFSARNENRVILNLAIQEACQ